MDIMDVRKTTTTTTNNSNSNSNNRCSSGYSRFRFAVVVRGGAYSVAYDATVAAVAVPATHLLCQICVCVNECSLTLIQSPATPAATTSTAAAVGEAK